MTPPDTTSALGIPRVSVLVLTYRHASAPEAIAAVQRTTHTTSFKTRLLLNGAPANVRADVRARVPGDVDILESEFNLGFGGGLNLLAAGGQSEFIALVNDDAIVAENWLDTLVATADELPDVAVVSSKIFYPDGSLQEAGARVTPEGLCLQVGIRSTEDLPEYNRRREIDYGSGAALLIRRAAFDEIGGFDEIYYPAYFEDVDLSLRLRGRGWKSVYEPAAVATHAQWGSSTEAERTFALRYNEATFFERWGPVFKSAAETTAADEAGSNASLAPLDVPALSADEAAPSGTNTSQASAAYTSWLLARLHEASSFQDNLADERAWLRAEVTNLTKALEHSEATVDALTGRVERAEAHASTESDRAARAEAAMHSLQNTLMWRARTTVSTALRRNAVVTRALDTKNQWLLARHEGTARRKGQDDRA